MNTYFSHILFGSLFLSCITSINLHGMHGKNIVTRTLIHTAKDLSHQTNPYQKDRGLKLFQQIVQCGKGYEEAKAACEQCITYQYDAYSEEMMIRKEALNLMTILVKEKATETINPSYVIHAKKATKERCLDVRLAGIDLFAALIDNGYGYKEAIDTALNAFYLNQHPLENQKLQNLLQKLLELTRKEQEEKTNE